MSPSLRFLALVVVAWAGVRAATLGKLPVASFLKVQPSEAHPAPPASPIATEFPALTPVAEPSLAEAAASPPPASSVTVPLPPATYPAGYRVIAVPAGMRFAMGPQGTSAVQTETHYTPLLQVPRQQFNASLPVLDEWPLSRIASESHSAARSETVTPEQSPVPALSQARLDRLQFSMWSLLRSTQALSATPPPSLAPNGTLGGSQAGARLVFNVNQMVGAVLRASTNVGRRGGEVAVGLRVHPLVSIPVWITAERRQRVGSSYGGRNAFAVFAEGGVYDRPLIAGFLLDAYAEAGVVRARRRDLFADGAFTLTRPVYKQFSAGFGAWGGYQPGAWRVDVGPRVTMRVRNNVRVHFDWRQRVAGRALPGSGPAVTLAGDF